MITTENEKNLNEVDLDQVSGGISGGNQMIDDLTVVCDLCGRKIMASNQNFYSTITHNGKVCHVCALCSKENLEPLFEYKNRIN